jgi:hypothetical protein
VPRQYDDAGAPDGGVDESMPGWGLAWAVRAGGDEHGESEDPGSMYREGGQAIAALDDGSVYLAGAVAETAVFGEGEPNETVFPDNVGWNDGFLARYEPDGTLSWVRRIGGADSGTGELAYDVVALEDGSAVVVGRLDASEVVLGEGEPNETVLTSDSPFNAYVARYSPVGDLEWAIEIPKAEGTYMVGWIVRALPDGRILAGGTLCGTAWPGGKSAISSLPSEDSSMNCDGFLAWFEEDGMLSQTVRIGSDSQVEPHNVDVMENGDVIVAARYDHHEDETFGLGEPNETVLHCENDFSCSSLARYDSQGRLAWVRDLGIFNTGFFLRVTMLKNGEIGLFAVFASPSDPDGDGVFYELCENTNEDVYGMIVATYSASDGSLVWARMGKCGEGQFWAESGNLYPMPGGGMVAVSPFGDTLVFDGEDEGQRSLVSAGKFDIAMMSLSASGEILWMHGMGGEGKDAPMAGAQLDGISMWLTGAYRSNPFIATSGHDDDIPLPLEGYSDVFLMRFDATTPPTE